MGNTAYGHSIIITELVTWVQGRMGLVALHDRVQTTTTTSDGKTFTANKVQSHGYYQPTPMGNTPYGHSIITTKKCTFFSLFCPKNARFSATSAQKMHVFQPLLPKKCTFFSHFHLKNAHFSATSTFFSHFCPKNALFSVTST
jgi:hypothetical protein